jgi:hypothetical protein
LGETVTVTLQFPTLTPTNFDPETLQNFFEELATASVTVALLGTSSPASFTAWDLVIVFLTDSTLLEMLLVVVEDDDTADTEN